MKNLVITDMHGDNPQGVIEYHLARGVEKLVCLGDYDTPTVLRAIRNLPIPKIMIVGNHEYHYVHEYGLDQTGYMGMDAGGYVELWTRNPIEKEFIREAIRHPTHETGVLVSNKVHNRNIAYVHASLLESDTEDPDVPGFVWGRMKKADSIKRNFAEMDKRQIDILR